ncbi:MAG TPA: aminotransferase class I/II-fold pyridoxal phosphate-dependent enzyme [Vicinamibacteria bacterium]|nr:aminotransferase class I/II-fold pyridoxal phosphate-dependent enzyme [Vicinamibacteria bacterium]
MPEAVRAATDLNTIAAGAAAGPGRVSTMVAGLTGSEILRIAGEIRALAAAGHTICDLTVGDFSPRQFPIPALLEDGIHAALRRGETNYPPSSGLAELREAVRRLYARELGLDYPVASVVITGGSRPAIDATYRTIVDPGDRVVYPVPSWNNNHYVHLVGGVGVPVRCGPEDRFLPRAEALRPLLPGARLLALNSPLNPAGTAFTAEALDGICLLVLEENARRASRGERPLYVMYDQVYWMLRFGGPPHVTPPALRPEIAAWTIFVDGISKAFAATGVRVGWTVGPADVVSRMSAVLGHMGAWAPRAEQAATASLLEDSSAVAAFHSRFIPGLQVRLEHLHRGLQGLRRDGHAVDSTAPAGAIYLAARIHPFGRRTPEGVELRSNEAIRQYLLARAGLAVVPFQAFGSTEEDGWFRLSVGAVSEAEIEAVLPRLREALSALD